MRVRLEHCVAIVVAVVMVSGCNGGADGGALIQEYPDGSGGGLAFSGTKANHPYSIDDATLCLDRRGRVTVESVEIVDPTGGLQVTAFSIRPARVGEFINYVEDPNQRLADVGYPTAPPMVVDRMCYDMAGTTSPPGASPPPGVGVSLLGIEVSKPTDRTATGSGLVVAYRSGQGRHKVFVPLGIVLCEGNAAEDPECEGQDVRPPDSR